MFAVLASSVNVMEQYFIIFKKNTAQFTVHPPHPSKKAIGKTNIGLSSQKLENIPIAKQRDNGLQLSCSAQNQRASIIA